MVIKYDDWLDRQRQRDLAALPIPTAYKGKTLDDVREHEGNAHALAMVRKWLDDARDYLNPESSKAGKGLLLFGKPGVGKTLLASIIASTMVMRAKRPGLVHFISMEGFNRHRLRKMELGRMLEGAPDGVKDEWWDHDAAIRKAYEARLLVLDDVGQENMSEHLAKVLNELLRDRYNRGCPTIVTSNIDPKRWAEDFANPSLGSFIWQACYVAPVAGEDARAPRARMVL